MKGSIWVLKLVDVLFQCLVILLKVHLEQTNFLDISLGSSFELGTQLLVAKHRNYINDNKLKILEEKIEEFQRMTMGFQNSLN